MVVCKVLGCIALLDEGETDWKVIVIDASDPLADKLHDINDVKVHCPELLENTVDWFRYYKVPDGKPVNEFAFNGECKDRSFALNIIKENAAMWNDLISGKTSSEIEIVNGTVKNSKECKPEESKNVPVESKKPDVELDKNVHRWSFVNKL